MRFSKLLVLLLAGVTVPASSVLAGMVEIEGDFDPATRQFNYRVINRGSHPIVYVRFPHYHADAFDAPKNWTIKSTALVGDFTPNEVGECTATAASPVDGVPPADSRVFHMRMSQADFGLGRGEATIRFANGDEEIVSNVRIPIDSTRRGFGPLPAIALGALLVLYGLYRAIRSRKSPASASGPRDEVI